MLVSPITGLTCSIDMQRVHSIMKRPLLLLHALSKFLATASSRFTVRWLFFLQCTIWQLKELSVIHMLYGLSSCECDRKEDDSNVACFSA